MKSFHVALALGATLVLLGSAPASAYTIGSGTLLSEGFNNQLGPDWEMQNGVPPNPSPWKQVLDGADRALYSDGYGPYPSSPTEHRWAG